MTSDLPDPKAHETAAMADRIRQSYPGLTVTHDVENGTSVTGILVEASSLSPTCWSWAPGTG